MSACRCSSRRRHTARRSSPWSSASRRSSSRTTEEGRGARRGPGSARASRSRSRRTIPIVVVYATAERIHVSRDGGRFWTALTVELASITAVAFCLTKTCGRIGDSPTSRRTTMSGLDDLIGSLTKSKASSTQGAQGGQSNLGIDDLLGGLLGGGSGRCRWRRRPPGSPRRAARRRRDEYRHALGRRHEHGRARRCPRPADRQVPPGRRALEDDAGREGERAQRAG